MRVRGVSEWSERGRTGAQEVNGGFLGKRTEGVLRERRRRMFGGGVRIDGACLGGADGRATRGWMEGWAGRS